MRWVKSCWLLRRQGSQDFLSSFTSSLGMRHSSRRDVQNLEGCCSTIELHPRTVNILPARVIRHACRSFVECNENGETQFACRCFPAHHCPDNLSINFDNRVFVFLLTIALIYFLLTSRSIISSMYDTLIYWATMPARWRTVLLQRCNLDTQNTSLPLPSFWRFVESRIGQ
jgi:hypothetical protein